MSAQEGRVAGGEARGTILAGGMALIGGALAFLGVFSYLAARFHYPEVLDGNAQDVLPALLATGAMGRAAWALTVCFRWSSFQRASARSRLSASVPRARCASERSSLFWRR